jgi:molecular chaperone GrpE
MRRDPVADPEPESLTSMPNDPRSPPADAGARPPRMTPDDATADTASAATAADSAPDLAALLQKAEAEAIEMKDAWLRSRAEIENVRRQGQNDLTKAYKYAIEKFAQELLGVKDSLELSLATDSASPEALKAGVELTLKQLAAAFDKAQIKEISPQGAKFDPHQHQAMAMVDSDKPANTVVTVFQKGYLLNDRVLRPALVAVAKAAEAKG